MAGWDAIAQCITNNSDVIGTDNERKICVENNYDVIIDNDSISVVSDTDWKVFPFSSYVWDDTLWVDEMTVDIRNHIYGNIY